MSELSPSLKKFMTSHTASLSSNWSNIKFEDTAVARLSHCAGFFRGLLAADKADFAEKMAKDLDRQLTYLNEYGGTEELGGSAPADCIVPAWRVVLYDDGTFGGFGVLWHKRIPASKHFEIVKAEYDKLQESGHQDEHMMMYDAIRNAHERFKVRKDLEVRRGFRPKWDTENTAWAEEFAHYGFNFNGGLLYHGPGGDEVFAVVIGDQATLWSVHT